VRDGDSLHVGGLSLRLFGIDAPERGQDCDLDGKPWPCGTWAREMLVRATEGQTLRCRAVELDRYGRTVATCEAAGDDLGQMMVISGAASAYARYSARYLPEEKLARAAGRGIWGGRMVSPSEWREEHRSAEGPAPQGCTIKGNVSANGRIFHLPGQRDYAATRINPAKGESWFCTVPEARAAGFRPATR
jgi:endonuclease YncB( thermonuclease family)